MSRQPRDATFYNKPLQCPILCLVEGPDEYEFLRFLRSRDDVQIHSYVGKDQLQVLLKDIQGVDGYAEIKKFVVFRDCDDNPAGALDSVLQQCKNGLGLSKKPNVKAKEWFKDAQGNDWCVYLLPDESSPGDLETLLWRGVEASCHTQCVDDLVQCLQGCDPIPIGAQSKARIYSWLATQEEPIRLLYGALDKKNKLFDPGHAAFADLAKFIDSITT